LTVAAAAAAATLLVGLGYVHLGGGVPYQKGLVVTLLQLGAYLAEEMVVLTHTNFH
jgi:hypothetical protein